MLRRLELGATQLQLLSHYFFYYLHTATNPQLHESFDLVKSRELPKILVGLSLLGAFPMLTLKLIKIVSTKQEIVIAMFRNIHYR